jgi:hypothetical protein
LFFKVSGSTLIYDQTLTEGAPGQSVRGVKKTNHTSHIILKYIVSFCEIVKESCRPCLIHFNLNLDYSLSLHLQLALTSIYSDETIKLYSLLLGLGATYSVIAVKCGYLPTAFVVSRRAHFEFSSL